MFLIVAVALSVISKVLQFVYKGKLGDVIVLFAGVFFVLAVLFSIERFEVLRIERPGEAWFIALLCCVAIVSFQLMMLLVMGYGQKLGLLMIVPLVTSVVLLVIKWL